MKNTANRTGIHGKLVTLRAVCRSDLEILRGFVNDPDVMQYSNVFWPINDDQQFAWFQTISTRSDVVWFAIDDDQGKDTHLIGTCCLVDIDWVARLAEMRIRLGDKNSWGKRMGAEACGLLLRHGFQSLDLQRIWVRLFDHNMRAKNLYHRLGFQDEGKLRRAAIINGNKEDVLLMGLLKSEWRPDPGSDIPLASP